MRQKVSANFYLDEFECNCGRPECDAPPPTPEIIALAQAIRDDLGIPLNITSGSRCAYWNAKKKGGKNSEHLRGNAVDFQASGGFVKFRIISSAIKNGAKGIGIGRTFIHVDPRKSASAWGYGQTD